jgi:cyclophilin family peptidyl-prolyl cis-trans isomerase
MRNYLPKVATWPTILVFVAVLGCGGQGSENNDATTSADRNPRSAMSPEGRSVDRSHPVVKIETSLGDVIVRLNAEQAMLTVDNFLEYVDGHHYNGTIFHQVNRGQAVLGGAYAKDMVQRPTRVAIRNEAHNGLKNRRGTIAMARRPDAIDTATCQFYFNLADNPVLDHKDRTAGGYGYCVFGEVTQGMDVLDRIGNVEVHDMPVPGGEPFESMPVEPVIIKSIRRAEP